MTESPKRDASDPQGELHWLGKGETEYPTEPERSILEAFQNRHPDRDYQIRLNCPEFTSLCPITGQPDFGHITIEYVADELCLESKSLKLYLFAYRNHGAFHEAVVNMIADDIHAAISPRTLTVRGEFLPRGGISIDVEVQRP